MGGVDALPSQLFGLLYGQRLTDLEACHRMFMRCVGDQPRITCEDFGCETQITRALRWRMREIGVRNRGHTYAHGKRIGRCDGLKALWSLERFRVALLPLPL
ncbi:hypothetical protein [Methylovirgula sp. 4M-Z18]|uniref:hypothetical protein n=1 Tax=Methylovirgula sp. 4M-Z18 TaxID=2293567 RepID=UPI000E2E9973|nr:hypothetical protein [Methylovirgula sp. 4M-Z18]